MPNHGRADRVARERRDRRGFGALPAHVAHDREPLALAGREQVVEVTADLMTVAGGAEQRCGLEAGDLRQDRRQQRRLQRLRDRRARAIEARVLDRCPGSQAEVLGEGDVARTEAASGLRGDEGDGSEHVVAGAQRHRHRRHHPEGAQQVQLARRVGRRP